MKKFGKQGISGSWGLSEDRFRFPDFFILRVSGNWYTVKNYNSVADEIDRLRELKQNALVESAEREELKPRIREMQEFLEQQSTEVTEYDELLVWRMIEKVTVYDEWFEVEFKSGAKVDVWR